MQLVSLLNPAFIRIGCEVKDKDEAIRSVFAEMCRDPWCRKNRDTILDSVSRREELGGTVFPSGIAIPHARLEGYDDILIGICLPERPFTADGIEVRMLVLILTSKAASNLYLNTLAALVGLSRNRDLFHRLAAAGSAESFMDLLRQAGIAVKKEISVGDIMTVDILTVSPDDSLKDLIDLFYKRNIGYAPVVGADGRLVGEVNVLDVIHTGVPDYATKIGNLKFLRTFEPFEDLLRNEERIRIRDVMKPPGQTLTPASSVIEAAVELVNRKRRHIPVVDGGKVVGVTSFMDILTKVLR